MITRCLVLLLGLLLGFSTFATPPPIDLLQQIQQQRPQPMLGDFDRMAEKRVVRVLLPFSKTFYFLDGATARGIEYDSVKAFEAFLNRDIKDPAQQIHVVLLPTARNQLLPKLLRGEGDLALGNLTITPGRRKIVDFSIPVYSTINEILVSHRDSAPVASLEELGGLQVYVRPSSSYYQSLLRLNRTLSTQNRPTVDLVLVDDLLEDEDLLEMIHAGLIERIVIDERKAELWEGILSDIRLDRQIILRQNGETGWAMRKDSPLLAAQVNAFIKTHREGTLYGNLLLKRYLNNQRWITRATSTLEWHKLQNSLPYFKTYGERYGFDYLMLLALGYQESKLDPTAKSPRGATGIMQLLPSTARYVGFEEIEGLDDNIHAGSKYLRYLVDQHFADPALTPLNQTLFAFAAYNAGPNRIRRLREQASAAGLDPNHWFGEVEQLAAREIGRETVLYVSNIFKYYVSYRLALQKKEAKAAAIERLQEETQNP